MNFLNMIIILLTTLTFPTDIFPILDGRTTPIFVESHYTFTNFEWARGFVIFKNGFSIGSTNTIILDLEYPVNGIIDFNNGGTIILNSQIKLDQNCSLISSGFIKTNGNTIYFSRPDFVITSTIHFINDDVVIDGNVSGNLSFNSFTGIFDFSQVSNVSFKNMSLSLKNPNYEIIFPPAKLTTMTFSEISLLLFPFSTFTVQANTVNFSDSTLIGQYVRFVAPVAFRAEGFTAIGESTTLSVKEFYIGGVESIFTINNLATLEFSKSSGTGISGNGRFFCNGKATMKALRQDINMNANQGILINSGSRLILDRMKLKIMS